MCGTALGVAVAGHLIANAHHRALTHNAVHLVVAVLAQGDGVLEAQEVTHTLRALRKLALCWGPPDYATALAITEAVKDDRKENCNSI